MDYIQIKNENDLVNLFYVAHTRIHYEVVEKLNKYIELKLEN